MSTHLVRHLSLLPALGLASLLLAAPGVAQDAAPGQVLESMALIRADSIRATTYFLASDHLKGRNTPSPGLDTAAAYLASRFAAAGLEVVQQPVEYQVSIPADGRLQGSLRRGDRRLDLGDPEVALCLAGAGPEERSFPECAVRHTDGSDLRNLPAAAAGGALLVSLGEDFAGTRMLGAMAGRGGYAVVLVQTPATPHGDGVYQEFVTAAREPARAGGRRRGPALPMIVVRGSAAQQALGGPGDAEPLTLDLTVGPTPTFSRAAQNVGGILRGRDPALADEFVMVTAHYDHIGWQPGGGEDSIYNGADDDASGTTAVVTLAEAFARLPEPPRRSLLFLCFCGEESGLGGSRAYAAAPLVPLEKTVADLNIEMIGRPEDLGPARAWVTGYSLSEVGPLLTDAARQIEVEVFEHPTLSDQLFRASDNISLAVAGVPAHSISAGTLHADYHQVGDEPDRLDHANMERVIRALFLGSWKIAERDEPPSWSEDERARPYREARGS